MVLSDLLQLLGEEIQDPDEGHRLCLHYQNNADGASETFLLFSVEFSSQNLGFIDPTAEVLHITVAERDLTIVQSPSLLSSNRKEGTTGAGRQAIQVKISLCSRLNIIS